MSLARILALLFLASLIWHSTSSRGQPTSRYPSVPNISKNTASPVPTTAAPSSAETKVKRVIDGDTIELEDGRRLRYIGIDTPEVVDPRKPVQCFGVEASLANKSLLEGKSVRLEKDVSETDKYGRLLRYVWIGETLVQDNLVRSGFARASTYPPDIKYQEQLLDAEREARLSNRGLWSACASPNASVTQPTSGPSKIPPDPACPIKGNISSSGKIYHLPGQSFYNQTVIDPDSGERWFCSEAEAQESGWRKSRR